MTPSCHSRSSRWITILGGFGQMGFAGAGSHVFQRAPGETLEALSARAVAVAETANERVVVIQGWSPEMDGLDGMAWMRMIGARLARSTNRCPHHLCWGSRVYRLRPLIPPSGTVGDVNNDATFPAGKPSNAGNNGEARSMRCYRMDLRDGAP
jgi:hypothetical protein